MMAKTFVISGAELDYLQESLEIVLQDYEGDYFNGADHDTPEEWQAFRAWYLGLIRMYLRLTERAAYLGPRFSWNADGPLDVGSGHEVKEVD
jgi:hypothetical protein